MTTLSPRGSTTRCEEEKEAVVAQLDRILEHPSFRNSMRSARFLRYVVEYWLEEGHQGEPLKERALGAALFGLDPAYDTNQNTVVRNAAVDVRKRLVLYYLEPGHSGEVQITMPAGAYLPHINFPSQMNQEAKALPEESQVEKGEEAGGTSEYVVADPLGRTRPFWRNNWFILSLLVAILLAVTTDVVVRIRVNSQVNPMAHMDELNQFWRPVLDASPPEPVILVCVEELPPTGTLGQHITTVGNALATADFVRVLSNNNKNFRISIANFVTTEDLQSSTVLVVGGIDNPWLSYVTDGLRFHLSSLKTADSKETIWIEDRKNPSRRDWSLQLPPPTDGVVHDFAIVARVVDPKTGLWRVIASGLDGTGTSVAARTIVDANYTKELASHLPKGWASKNIEVVIAIDIVNGKTGYPQVVAYEVW